MAAISLAELEYLHANICQALGDTKRLQILYALHAQPCNVTTLAESLNTPQPTISRHLSLLRQRGLVKTERDGPSVIYRVADTRIIDVLDQMRALLRDLHSEQTKSLG